jgi:probable rRNA maturation factor
VQVEVCVQEYSEAGNTESYEELVNSSRETHCSIPSEVWELWFQKWLEALQPDLSPIQAYELSLRLTDDREIQSLNYQYRQQNKPTDVLAFAALETVGPPTEEMRSALPVYLGDIVISIDTAQRQAQSQEHSLETELAWLAAHGLLHLLGWDHPDDVSLAQMLSQQQALLQTVGLRIENG